MEIKNCEQYVLMVLEQKENEILELKSEIETLKHKIKELSNE